MDINSYTSNVNYMKYIGYKNKMYMDKDAVLYSNFFYKKENIEGSCTDWTNFIQSSLTIPVPGAKFYNISALFSYGSVDSESATTEIFVCSDPIPLSSIINALSSSLVANIKCNNHLWRIGVCSTGLSLCVDCPSVCNACPGDSFFVSPCKTTCRSDLFSSTIIKMNLIQEILYPTLLDPLTILTSSTTAVVYTNISAPGVIYCSAKTQNETVNTVFDVAKSFFSFTDLTINVTSVPVSVVIRNLYPDTSYSIYCATRSLSGYYMPLDDVITSKTEGITKCCRILKFVTKVPTLLQYTGNTDIDYQTFGFILNAPPTKQTEVKLVSNLCPNSLNTMSRPSFSPDVFQFDGSSLSLEGTFVIRATSPGCFHLQVYTENASYLSDTWVVNIVSSSTPPLPPLMASAMFTNNGRGLVVAFDRKTNLAEKGYEMFDCSSVLEFSSDDIAVCFWLNDKSISVLPLGSHTLNVSLNSTISLNKNVLRAFCPSNPTFDCSKRLYSPKMSTLLLPPSSPLIPSPSISMPSIISSCDDLVIDCSNSHGNGGRPWNVVSFTVIQSGSYQNTSNIIAILSIVNSTEDLIFIPNEYLIPGFSYLISLKLQNFLGGSNKVSKMVTVSKKALIPMLTIAGASNLLITRNQPLSLSASALVSTCSGMPYKTFSYVWKIYDGVIFLPNMMSTSVDPRFLKLPSYSLDVGHTYTIVSIAELEIPGSKSISATSSVLVTVESSGIYATIKGGTFRSISYFDNFYLDASDSQSIDYPTSSKLSFYWSCSMHFPNFGSLCGSFVNFQNFSILHSSGNISLPGNVLNFSVIVSDMSGTSAQASTLVTIVLDSIPKFQLGSIASKYNPGDTLKLPLLVEAKDGPFSVSWGCTQIKQSLLASFSQEELSFTSTEGRLLHLPLLLSPGLLVAGRTYSFTISGGFLDTNHTLANTASLGLTIVMNRPPTGGVFYVNPSSGIALTTSFHLKTSAWVDDVDDFPLIYTMMYSAAPGDKTIVKSASVITNVNAFLGQGFQSYDFMVTCAMTVVDLYGGVSSLSSDVKVEPMTVFTGVKDDLSAALSSVSIERVSQIVGAVTNAVNTVNCPPISKCVLFNREPCTIIPGTCGECLPGYEGIVGPANALCIATSENAQGELQSKGRRLESESLSQMVYNGGLCRKNTNCISGWCFRGRCRETYKTCPNDCTYNLIRQNYNGDCIFLNANGQQVNDCPLGNTFCTATCSCKQNFYGQDCSLSRSTFIQRLDLRAVLCKNVRKTVEYLDASVDSVLSLTSTIAGLFVDITQLNETSVFDCTSALNTLILRNPAIASDNNVISKVLNTFSRYTDNKELQNFPKILAMLLDVISSIVEQRQAGLLLGQTPTSILTQNIRFVTTKALSDSFVSVNPLALPNTFWERLSQTNPTTITVHTNLSAKVSQSELGVTLLQFNNNPRSQAINTTSVIMELKYFSGGPSVSNFSVFFRNIDPVHYFVSTASQGIVKCMESPKPYNVLVYCNGTHPARNVTCDGKLRSRFYYTCPVVSKLPICTYWDDFAFVKNENCSVAAFSENHTVCECFHRLIDNQRRRLDSNPNSRVTVRQELSSIAQITYTPFILRFQDDSIPTVAYSSVFAVTMSLIAALLSVGFYKAKYAARKDVREFQDTESSQIARNEFHDSILRLALPAEFAPSPWYTRYWQCLLTHHDLIRFLYYNADGSENRTFNFYRILSNVFSIFATVSFLAYIYFYDDGTCEAINEPNICSARTFSVIRVGSSCYWNTVHDYCSFLKPNDTGLLVHIVIVITTATVTFLLDVLSNWAICEAMKLFVRRKKSKSSVHISPDDASVKKGDVDIFLKHKNTSWLAMMGARITIMIRDMDSVNTDVELKRMVKKLREGMKAPKSFVQVSYNSFFEKVEREYYRKELHWRAGKIEKDYEPDVIRRLDDARLIAKDTVNVLAHFLPYTSAEKFQAAVLQLFAAHFLHGYKSKLSQFYLENMGYLGEYKRSIRSRIVSFLALLVYLVTLSGLGTMIFIFGGNMGSDSCNVSCF